MYGRKGMDRARVIFGQAGLPEQFARVDSGSLQSVKCSNEVYMGKEYLSSASHTPPVVKEGETCVMACMYAASNESNPHALACRPTPSAALCFASTVTLYRT